VAHHIQLSLKAIEQAPAVARAAGITLGEQLAGLVLMYHHVYSHKTDRATPGLLMGWFGVARGALERLVDAEVDFGHLSLTERGSQTPMGPDVWRIRGAHRYIRLRQTLSDGGKKSARNLKQFQRPAESEGRSGPFPSDLPARPGRALSDAEQCWDLLERARVEYCIGVGVPPGESIRPKLCNKKMNDAVLAAGIPDDSIIGGQRYTKWDYLSLLFERYLLQERIGVKDREGNVCTPPWPIPLFLSPNVLLGFKREYEAEAA
jgi:hypothetical protein